MIFLAYRNERGVKVFIYIMCVYGVGTDRCIKHKTEILSYNNVAVFKVSQGKD